MRMICTCNRSNPQPTNRPTMKSHPLFFSSLLALTAAVTPLQAQLRITEVMSNGDTADWFEITNYGAAAADITGYKMDDGSFASGTAVALNGVTSIAPGESVVFIESALGALVSAFETNWSLDGSKQVGYYSGTGVGLSGSGDGVTVFTSANAELADPFSGLIRVSFGAATQGTSFKPVTRTDSSNAFTVDYAVTFPASNSLTSTLKGSIALAGAEIPAFDPLSGRAFASSGAGIQVVNLADPANPVFISTITSATRKPTSVTSRPTR